MKLIIDNRSNKSDSVALAMVKAVVDGGRISKRGKCYCLATTIPVWDLVVYAKNNKASDTFVVMDFPSSQEGEKA